MFKATNIGQKAQELCAYPKFVGNFAFLKSTFDPNFNFFIKSFLKFSCLRIEYQTYLSFKISNICLKTPFP